jgi:hypothetical protein
VAVPPGRHRACLAALSAAEGQKLKSAVSFPASGAPQFQKIPFNLEEEASAEFNTDANRTFGATEGRIARRLQCG